MEDDARFCPQCGQAAPQLPAQQPAQQAPAQSQQPAPQAYAPQPQQSVSQPVPPAAPQPQQAPHQPYAPQQVPPQARQAVPRQTVNRVSVPQPPQGYVPATVRPEPKKRKYKAPIIIAVALVLVVVLVLGFVKPGFFLNKGGKNETLINRVEVFIPNPTGPESLTGLVGELAVEYYIEARLYLEKLSEYDLNELDGEKFVQLVSDTVAAFENADKATEFLSRVVDLWMECDDARTKPTYKVTQKAGAVKNNDPLMITAFADDPSESEIRAEDIVAAFDKAKNGQKIKAVATLLNTDAKHAMIQLQMAQAELEKRGYDKIADQADTCVKVAKTLKTAGAVAGLVVTAMPLATGAVATMAAGEMLVTGTGVVVSAVNTGLDVVSTGAMYVYGTDQNQVSEAADAIADSKFMQTVNLVTGVAGVGYNIKNLIEKADVNNLSKYLTSLSSNGGYEGSDVYGLLTFALGNLDKLPGPQGELADTAMKTLVSITTHTQEDGLLVKIADTIMGDDEKKMEAVSKLLDEFNLPSDSRSLIESAVGLYTTGKEPEKPLETDPADPIPAELVEQLLTERAAIAPGSGTIDLDELIGMVEGFMLELTECEPPSEAPIETPASSGEPGSSSSSSGSETAYDKVTGYYRCTGTKRDNMGDDKWETEDCSMSFNIKVNDNGQLVWASGYGDYYDEQVLILDSTDGAYHYSDNWDDVADEPSWFTEYGSFTFYQENGVKKLHVVIQQIDNDYGTVESVWDLTGADE